MTDKIRRDRSPLTTALQPLPVPPAVTMGSAPPRLRRPTPLDHFRVTRQPAPTIPAAAADGPALGVSPWRAFSARTLVPAGARAEALARVETDGLWLKQLPALLQDDEDVVLAAVSQNGLALEFASARLRASPGVLAAACGHSPQAARFADDSAPTGDWLTAAMTKDVTLYGHLPPSLRAREDVARLALTLSPWALEQLPDALRNRPDMVLPALLVAPGLIASCGPAVKADRAVILRLVGISGMVLAHASAELRKDREICMLAVSRNGNAFTSVDESLRSDRELCLCAVTQVGTVLQHIPAPHNADRTLVLRALASTVDAWPFVPADLRKNPDFQRLAVGVNTALLQHCPSLKTNLPFLVHLAQVNGEVIQHLPPERRRDPVVLRSAAFSAPSSLRHADPAVLRRNPDVCLTALKKDPAAWRLIPPELTSDPAFIRRAVRINGMVLTVLPEPTRLQSDLWAMAVQSNGLSLQVIPEAQRTRSLVEMALAQDGMALPLVPEPLRSDPALAELALRSNPMVIEHLTPAVLADRDFILRMIPSVPWILSLASDAVRAHRDVVLAAVRADGSALEVASADLRSDPEVTRTAVANNPVAIFGVPEGAPERAELVTVAMDQHPGSYAFLTEAERANPELALQAVQRHVSNLTSVPAPLSADRAFWAKAVALNPLLLWCAKDLASPVAPLLEELVRADAALEKTYTSLVERAAAAGIRRLERFDVPLLEEVLKNREAVDQADGRPLAVVISGVDDWNRAGTVQRLSNLVPHHRLLYFDVETDRELLERLRAATRAQKATFVEIFGHGTSTMQAMGADDPAQSPASHDELYVDVFDWHEFRRESLRDGVEPGAHVVLASCSNGAGGPHEVNMARFWSSLLPTTNVYAMRAPDNLQPRFAADGSFVSPGYDLGPLFTRHFPPRTAPRLPQ